MAKTISSSSPTLTLRDLNRATLARQMLLARERKTPLAAIERLLGMQAQLPKPPFIGLWTRLDGFRPEELLRLVEERAVVRATAMRVTIHLLSAKDYVQLRPALEPALTRGLHAAIGKRAKALDIDALVKQARAFFAEEPRTFAELRSVLGKPGKSAKNGKSSRPSKSNEPLDESGMAFAVRTHLPLVQVPNGTRWGWGGSSDFALAEQWLGTQWLGTTQAPSEAESTRELVLRYLAAFGPASVADARAWSGHPSLQPVFETLRPKLVTFQDDKGRELFDLPKAPRPGPDVEAPVRFLPEFDNVLLAHADRRRVMGDVVSSKIFLVAARGLATILVDGMITGSWKIERTKGGSTLEIQPFAALSRSTAAALGDEGEKLVRFLAGEGDEGAPGTIDVRIARPVPGA